MLKISNLAIDALESKIEKMRKWVMSEYYSWRHELFIYTDAIVDESDELVEAIQLDIIELPTALGEHKEGSLAYEVIAYRLKHGIDLMEDEKDWYDTPPLISHVRKHLKDMEQHGDENEFYLKLAVNHLQELEEPIRLLCDEETTKKALKWCHIQKGV